MKQQKSYIGMYAYFLFEWLSNGFPLAPSFNIFLLERGNAPHRKKCISILEFIISSGIWETSRYSRSHLTRLFNTAALGAPEIGSIFRHQKINYHILDIYNCGVFFLSDFFIRPGLKEHAHEPDYPFKCYNFSNPIFMDVKKCLVMAPYLKWV
jgi:hypothetical protein